EFSSGVPVEGCDGGVKEMVLEVVRGKWMMPTAEAANFPCSNRVIKDWIGRQNFGVTKDAHIVE
ncbi:hypothetical protein RvY_17128, partial [Ramazzottius varieornatus]